MDHTYRITPKRKRSFLFGLSVNTNIIIFNVVFFIVAIILLGIFGESIWGYISISRAGIQQGYVWTFLTSMFMHGNFFHLFINMFSLFFVGNLLQRILGKKRFVWFYLTAGFFAGGLHILFETVPAVGASGALFGLIGLMMLLTPNLPVFVMFIPIPIKIKYAAPGMLALLWLVSVGADLPIGNIAHLGGLIAGLVYGLYLRKNYKNKIKMISRHFS